MEEQNSRHSSGTETKYIKNILKKLKKRTKKEPVFYTGSMNTFVCCSRSDIQINVASPL